MAAKSKPLCATINYHPTLTPIKLINNYQLVTQDNLENFGGKMQSPPDNQATAGTKKGGANYPRPSSKVYIPHIVEATSSLQCGFDSARTMLKENKSRRITVLFAT